ncbi:MAG: hypothetical protein HZB67_05730 [Candidatus Aenigmarchaeota archaeon]|nr:hypothetical protein [Candidatus Aenigmarchaeota archaeon]
MKKHAIIFVVLVLFAATAFADSGGEIYTNLPPGQESGAEPSHTICGDGVCDTNEINICEQDCGITVGAGSQIVDQSSPEGSDEVTGGFTVGDNTIFYVVSVIALLSAAMIIAYVSFSSKSKEKALLKRIRS